MLAILFQEKTKKMLLFPKNAEKNASIIEKVHSCESRPFAVHYEKIRNYLREKATNKAKIHSLTPKNEHLSIDQFQKGFLHFNQHSIKCNI